MGIVTEMLTVLGANLPLVAVGCAEVLAAAALLGRAAVMRTQPGKTRASLAPVGMNRDIQRVLRLESGEVMLVLRREDMMLLACTGDPEKLLGVSYTALRDNIANLNAAFSDKSRCRAVWKKYMAWDGREMFDEAVQSGDGRWMRFIVSRTPDGEYDLLCFRDIAALHDRIEECEKRLAGAEEESRAKTNFLSRMSHEIRTPMNGIIGMTEIALREDQPEKARLECMEKVRKSSHYLLSLLNDILDMSKIESGKMTLAREPFSLRTVLSELHPVLDSRFEEKRQCFLTQIALTGDWFYGDRLRISQVLINLLGNAGKYSSEDTQITLTVQEHSRKDDAVEIYFAVKDQGIGISEEDRLRIFQSFEQVDSPTARQQGTGLGLAISNRLVHMMGGSIELESQLGKGSTFYFTLRLPPAEEQAAEEFTQPHIDLSGKRILVAEDNALNMDIVQFFLEDFGCIVTPASDGKQALEQFRDSPEGYFDLILMDVMMPIMDGLEATNAIRTLPRADSRTIPIVALSANAFDEDVKRSLASGMNAHLSKPIESVKLADVLSKMLAKQ